MDESSRSTYMQMWITYNIFVGAYTGLITEFIMLGSTIISMLRNDLKKEKEYKDEKK